MLDKKKYCPLWCCSIVPITSSMTPPSNQTNGNQLIGYTTTTNSVTIEATKPNIYAQTYTYCMSKIYIIQQYVEIGMW